MVPNTTLDIALLGIWGLVPKDDPYPVHTHALIRVTIEYQKSGHVVTCGMSHISTYMKLSKGSRGGRYEGTTPVYTFTYRGACTAQLLDTSYNARSKVRSARGTHI